MASSIERRGCRALGALSAVLLAVSCKEPAAPPGAGCNVLGTWSVRVVWKEGDCDILSPDGEPMRIFVTRGWDGSIAVAKGSQLGTSPVEATIVEADPKACTFTVLGDSEGREEPPARLVLRMKQQGDTASGTAALEHPVAPESAGKAGACRQRGTVEATKQ